MITAKKILLKIVSYFRVRNLATVFFVFIITFLVAGHVDATIGTAVATVVGWLLFAIAWALGQLLVLMMEILVWIAQWSTFIYAPAVTLGWKIVRDICNMFFVVIMLVIAFATVLRVEKYSYQKLLPKLIIMAILINFSKMICGLIIDVSQVVMLTFVNSFKDVAGANLTNMLGLNGLTSMSANDANSSNTGGAEVTGWSILGAYILAIIYIIISLITVTTMVIMLAVRIVMIWIHVVLSPMAYLLAAFPAGQSYAEKWWSDFTKNIIVGPILAFFIWLSFAALGNVSSVSSTGGVSASDPTNPNFNNTGQGNESLTVAGSPDHMLNFVISIAMLYGGLQIAQSIGGAAGGIAGKGMAAINKGKGMTVKGFRKAGGALAYGAIANKTMAPITKNVLGKIAATSGVGGRLLGAVGVRGLAGKGLVAFNQQQKKIEEQAQKKMEGFKDTRVMARYAREGAWTPTGAAAQKKASGMMPSALYTGSAASRTRVEQKLAGMTREDLAKLSDAEWHAIGRTGTELTGRSIGYIEKNSDDRGAYNLGREAFGAPLVSGRTQNGAILTTADRYGSYYRRNAAGTLHADERDTLRRAGSHHTQYLREENSEPVSLEPEKETRVPEDAQDAPRGKGSLAVNEIARGASSTVAVDFDKLNLSEIDKGKDADWRNTRGFNTTDQALVGKIASKMLEVINREKGQLSAKASLNPGEQKRLTSLNKAEEYFKAPEKIDNLSMLNSSAAKFRVSDVKEAKIHEEIHGLGYGEADVRSATSSIIKDRNYDARYDRQQIDGILAENNQQGNTPKRSVKEISQQQEAAELELSSEPKVSAEGLNTDALEKSLEKFSSRMEEVSKEFSVAGNSKNFSSNPSVIGSDNVSLFKNLRKTIESSNDKIAKKISALGGSKAQSPLEVDVVYKEASSEK